MAVYIGHVDSVTSARSAADGAMALQGEQISEARNDIRRDQKETAYLEFYGAIPRNVPDCGSARSMVRQDAPKGALGRVMIYGSPEARAMALGIYSDFQYLGYCGWNFMLKASVRTKRTDKSTATKSAKEEFARRVRTIQDDLDNKFSQLMCRELAARPLGSATNDCAVAPR